MKYIVIEVGGELMPVIFPDSPKLSHKAVWRGIQDGVRMQSREGGNGGSVMPVSMGFVYGVSATGVDGYSESARYGFDCVPREMWDVTESHPETDLLLINGGQTHEAIKEEQAKREVVTHRITLGRMIRGSTDDTRHLSSSQRRKRVEEYISIHLADECNAAGGFGPYIQKAREYS